MDVLQLVPAVALSFGATYYLGKACLALIVNSLETPGRTPVSGAQRAKISVSGDTTVN
jgi:hypothetical protein